MGRRSLYGDAEQSRFHVTPGAPGGTRVINLLNGDGGTPLGSHAVDAFDAYTYNVFAAGKYRGFSVSTEWWLRNLNHFRTTPNGGGTILYSDSLGPNGAARTALFPSGNGLIDYGMNLAGGYYLIPRKLEVAARWSWVRGNSGDINGDGTFRTVNVAGVTGVQIVNGAFRNFHDANEYTVGLNYYFRRQLIKWQTDLSFYSGGNPAAAGASVAGWLTGIDGWLLSLPTTGGVLAGKTPIVYRGCISWSGKSSHRPWLGIEAALDRVAASVTVNYVPPSPDRCRRPLATTDALRPILAPRNSPIREFGFHDEVLAAELSSAAPC
ncbi:MAG: hypothetical protein QM811_32000 [Pirellulales bacterium]